MLPNICRIRRVLKFHPVSQLGEYHDCSEIIGIRRNSVHRFGIG
jgi:hypothetical protein